MTLSVEKRIELFQRVLTSIPSLSPFLIPSIARYFVQLGRIVDAEKMLLERLKYAEQSTATINALSDLYIEYAMIKSSGRLFQGLQSKYPESKGLSVDLLQIFILTDRYDLALKYTNTLISANYMNGKLEFLRMVLLMTLGRRDTVQSMMGSEEPRWLEVSKQWDI